MEQTVIDSRFLQTCDIPVEEFRIEPFTMVIFGGEGDLTRRKLIPTLFHLYLENELSKGFSIIGFGKMELEVDEYRNMMKEAVKKHGEEPFDDGKWDEFSSHLYFLSGHFEDDRNYERLCNTISHVSAPTAKGTTDVIYYMAVPAEVMPVAVVKLKEHELCQGKFNAKIIVEKPFGRDRQSAVKLNSILTEAFREDQIYRIDHYLAKETIQNIIFLRFGNTIFERLWNSRYVDNVQITVAEDIGIEHRGAFYDQTGVVRDMVQNHIMQLIGFIAMEPPIGFEANALRDEKVKVFRSIQPMNDEYIDKFTVRGQYGPGMINEGHVPGYREETGAPGSNTPTFFAAKFYIANWRWAGVPFYVRTGKRMLKRIAEICLQFKQPPLRLFGRTCDVLEPNVLTLTIQPEEKIIQRFGVKYPYAQNKIYSVDMGFSYQDTFKVKPHPPYERLLIDCMKGDLTLFVRQDGLEAMWEVVDPLIARWENMPPTNFPNYPAGTWGPEEADLLLNNEGRRWITY